MPLVKLTIPPGMRRNGTKYQTKDRWYDGQLMRFHEGNTIPIGGWQPLFDQALQIPVQLDGVARGALSWQGTSGGGFVSFGTVNKLYAFVNSLEDITPAGFTPGNPDSTFPSGGAAYGEGFYGRLLYGKGTPGAGDIADGDVWAMDTFGSFWVGVMFPSDNILYVWDNVLANVAVPAANAPTANRGCFVTPERFLVALGAGGEQRKVAWADRETTDVWTPAVDNQAGDFTLEGPGRIMAARRSRGDSLIWTDFALYSMTFLGGTAVYGFQKRGFECGLVAPNAVVQVPSGFIWMGDRSFFSHDGYVRPLESEVGEFVFDDFNFDQRYKVNSLNIREFSEAWWFYPSKMSSENDSYVVYNYAENHWAFGRLPRTASVDSDPVVGFPVMVDQNGYVYTHENGIIRKDTEGVSQNPEIESGPLEIGDGEDYAHVLQVFPDFEGVDPGFDQRPPPALESVLGTLFGAAYPQSTEESTGTFAMTEPTSVRINGRQIRIKVQQIVPDTTPLWRLGHIRLDVRPGGKR